MKLCKQIKEMGFTGIVLFISLLFVGGFHEYFSCFLSLVILILLIIINKKRKLLFYLNLTSASILSIVIFYGFSVFWAVDYGMALIGFFKFLPVVLYLFLIMQNDSAEKTLKILPYFAAIVSVVSIICMQIPKLYPFFGVAGRLGGTFQYPNSFALFLLIAEIITVSKEKRTKKDILVIVILIFSILYTGSRTVLALAVVANIVLICIEKNKRIKYTVFAALAVAAAAGAVFAIALGNGAVFSRLFRMSFTESTFVGRLLYFKDALPLILKHPFGLGYMGYYYVQQSVQTGMYSVMFIHNDFLQLFLDIGWVPAGLFTAAVVKAAFFGKKSIYLRMIICIIALHCCFDFNLQFVAVFMLFLLFLNVTDGKKYTLTNAGALTAVSSAIAILCLYFGIALLLARFGYYEVSLKMYPFNTQAQIHVLAKSDDVSSADKIADSIIDRNKYVISSYNAKAKYSYSIGDFEKLIEYKNKIFAIAPFLHEEKEEYCSMLINGIMLYSRAGDYESASVCLKELMKTRDEVHNIKSKLSKFGTMIKDQPKDSLSDDLESYILKLEKGISQ